MFTRALVSRLLGGVVWAAFLPAATVQAQGEWRNWRGPGGAGSAGDASPPLVWSEEQNVLWKTALPGSGNGSVIIEGDRLYLLTAIPVADDASELPAADSITPFDPLTGGAQENERGSSQEQGGRRRFGRGHGGSLPTPTTPYDFAVIAFDRHDGSVVWQRNVHRETPHEGTHRDGSYASAAPVTDGEVLIANFGSRGTYALDLDGNVLWGVDLGDMAVGGTFGEGASAAVHGDVVVVNWDHEGESFVVGLDRRDGSERWRQPRPERTTWATPLIVEYEGRAQVLVSGAMGRSYDLESGEVIWSLDALNSNAIPTPICVDDVVYFATGYGGSSIYAIDLALARGELTELDAPDAVLWFEVENAPYVPSPTLHNGVLYCLKSTAAILTAFDARSGERVHGPARIEGVSNVYSSLLGAGDHLYVFDREGACSVLRASGDHAVLHTNTLDDRFDASAAIVDDRIHLRGAKSLYCLAELQD